MPALTSIVARSNNPTDPGSPAKLEGVCSLPWATSLRPSLRADARADVLSQRLVWIILSRSEELLDLLMGGSVWSLSAGEINQGKVSATSKACGACIDRSFDQTGAGLSVAKCGYLWLPVVTCGYFLLYVAICGYLC
ncbi:hypothetical protein RRG08_019751 [Elysia crispata]|uniref:Uncharacterized protein n=1 Tax=Elysia crispata TaxID=231223 RepID=A0AAE0Y8T9_9GAST|nr:hypothetical protein RRG08_019751 [Elysia crispata]